MAGSSSAGATSRQRPYELALGKIRVLDARIAEAEMNDLVYGLYGLTEEERRMVEEDR